MVIEKFFSTEMRSTRLCRPYY